MCRTSKQDRTSQPLATASLCKLAPCHSKPVQACRVEALLLHRRTSPSPSFCEVQVRQPRFWTVFRSSKWPLKWTREVICFWIINLQETLRTPASIPRETRRKPHRKPAGNRQALSRKPIGNPAENLVGTHVGNYC